MKRAASEFHPELLRLFDGYVHGAISRRDFLDQAGRFAASGLTALGILQSLSPRYAEAQQIHDDDERVDAGYAEYSSPKGSGTMRGYLVRPAGVSGKLPGVVVIHENRGLNPHIEDVARRFALAGFLAFAPDALTPLGGYPGTDDDGRALQAKLDRDTMIEDFAAAVVYLRAQPGCTAKVGVVGFCFGGGMASILAARLPHLNAAVSFYGRAPELSEVPNIQAPLLLHFAGLDERINAGWPEYERALKTHKKTYTAYLYADVHHGFHNDTTPRYDETAAKLAWQRTVDFFAKSLREVEPSAAVEPDSADQQEP